MIINLLLISLILFVIAVIYINLISTATNCLRESAITKNIITPDLTLMYINLILGIILVLVAIIGIYTSIYTNTTQNIIDNKLQFLRT